MSMISAQIDELRELVGDGSMEWVAGPVRASVLREAADTIWQLRDDLQRANAENAKLREELADAPKCETCEAMLDCDECFRADVSHKERRRLAAENAKLRELVRDMLETLYWGDYYLKQTGRTFQPSRYETRMRELGIEVTE